jgi:hypothetical protein
MKFSSAIFFLSILSLADAFAPSFSVFRSVSTVLRSTPGDDDVKAKRMQEIMKEETSNPFNMNAAAEQMKNIKPEDLERMVQEMETMNPIQKQALKAMGMNPEMMKKTMAMMRDNPQMVESAQILMRDMTPEQMMEQSRMAQQKMSTMTDEELEETNSAIKSIPKEALDEAVGILSKQQFSSSGDVNAESEVGSEDDALFESSSSSTSIATGAGTSSDPAVLDVMFSVAEFMSEPPTGGVALAGFSALPTVQLLSGERDEDLSVAELKECWASGSLGATRVDRAGFERVWKEVQEYFEDDIMGEARKEAKKSVTTQKNRGGTEPPVAASTSTSTATTPSTTTTIGENLKPDQLKAINDRVKDMDDNEVSQMLEAMQKMDPDQEDRMKAMGVDPKMMQRTAEMMKTNPMMRKAAQSMMDNMSPEQMLKMSQQAQQQMQNMSPEEMEQAMKQIKDNSEK